MSRTQVVLLGTGTPNADPDRSGPAIAIVVDDTPYLVDLGPGVIRRAAAAFRAGVTGLAIQRLTRAFITHLHSDHTLGYPDFIFSPWVLGRRGPVEVYGPAGLQTMTDHLLLAYQEDLRIRVEGLEPSNPDGYKVIVHEIGPGVVYQDERVKVIAFPVEHGPTIQAFGFRVETPDKCVVVSGDTVPVPAMIEFSQGCDILIHEVYSAVRLAARPPEWRHYHSHSHTSTRELAELANQIRPGLLILYHQLTWGATDDDLLAEIRQVYDGPVVSGQDMGVF